RRWRASSHGAPSRTSSCIERRNSPWPRPFDRGAGARRDSAARPVQSRGRRIADLTPGSARRRIQEVLRDRRPVAAEDPPLQDGTGWCALDGDVVEPADIELEGGFHPRGGQVNLAAAADPE